MGRSWRIFRIWSLIQPPPLLSILLLIFLFFILFLHPRPTEIENRRDRVGEASVTFNWPTVTNDKFSGNDRMPREKGGESRPRGERGEHQMDAETLWHSSDSELSYSERGDCGRTRSRNEGEMMNRKHTALAPEPMNSDIK